MRATLEAVLNQVTYKAGWRFDMYRRLEDGSLLLTVQHTAPDSYGKSETVGVYRSSTVPPSLYDRPDLFIAWVRRQVIELELHEVDEWFKVAGAHYHDPHPS